MVSPPVGGPLVLCWRCTAVPQVIYDLPVGLSVGLWVGALVGLLVGLLVGRLVG